MLEDYREFSADYEDCLQRHVNPVDGVSNGSIRVYAVDNSVEDENWKEVLEKIKSAQKAFALICNKPKSHLKSENEVRPIETVKRVGYESIPYLASHSEDWLARTATGLKPARLFSRVEEDDFLIYENRVVKTLLDIVLVYLRRAEKKLNDMKSQLKGIMNSTVQATGFGFDKRFQIAVSELLADSTDSDSVRSEKLKNIEKLLVQTRTLLKKYGMLRYSTLYRKLMKIKRVQNPLNQTNILMMDKNYKQVFALWKVMQKATRLYSRKEDEQLEETLLEKLTWYRNFNKTLMGYAAQNLGFESDDGVMYHKYDSQYGNKRRELFELSINEEDGLIHCILRDPVKREMVLQNGLKSPIHDGETVGKFSLDGEKLLWENDSDDDDIKAFCDLFKKQIHGKNKRDVDHLRTSLESAMLEHNRKYPPVPQSHVVIVPFPDELSEQGAVEFRRSIQEEAMEIAKESSAQYVIYALPLCASGEQQALDYAHGADDKLMILPVTVYDINSYRRLQNVLLRQIAHIDSKMASIFDSDEGLIPVETLCPHCGHKYVYLSCEARADVLEEMRNVEKDSFFLLDSLFKYKDIVEMKLGEDKFLSVCPKCRKSPSDYS